MASKRKSILALVLFSLVSACSTVTSTPPVIAQADGMWALLPIKNLSTTPSAGEKVASIVETQLRARGVQTIESFVRKDSLSLVSLLDNTERSTEAANWAKESGAQYALTGTVHEWHYKSGADKEPAVGLSLKLIDVATEEVLWQGSSARTGWGYSNLSSVGSRVINGLLEKVRIQDGVQ
jgi:TolB-like protein